jgi:hypothetical protein
MIPAWRKTPDGSFSEQLIWYDPGKKLLVASSDGVVNLLDMASGNRLGGTFVYSKSDSMIVIGPEGHFKCDRDCAHELLYVAELDDGSQVTLSTEEFAKRFGWKNDPSKATLGWRK